MPFDMLLEPLDPHIGARPQREAPALAQLTREMHERPLWMIRDAMPIETDLETWQAARQEMVDIQKARGFPLAMAAINRMNFLLRGIPVVIKDEA